MRHISDLLIVNDLTGGDFKMKNNDIKVVLFVHIGVNTLNNSRQKSFKDEFFLHLCNLVL